MNKNDCLKKACQVIRRRIRFKSAMLRLPGTPFPQDDTKAISEAASLYVETWIVPLLDAIESGDMSLVREFCQFEQGDSMKCNPSNLNQ